MEHTNFEGYTNFIDEIDDEQFDNFFSKKARRKRKERQAERRGIARLVMMYKAKGVSTKKSLANAMRDIQTIKRKGLKVSSREIGNIVNKIKMGISSRKPMSKQELRMTRNKSVQEELMPESSESSRPQEELMPESPASARPPRKNRKKYIDKALIKIRGAIKDSQANTDDDDVDLRGGGIAPIEKTSLSGKNADSFFQKNKMPILVVGGLVVAGVVYFKFIKK
jgi:hypothetical protein